MLIGIVAVIVVVTILLGGGRFTRLAQLQIRAAWLVGVALAIQIAIISLFDIESIIVARSLHVLTYLMIGVCMVLNRAIPWMWVLTLGWACNFAAIAVNGGVMPTSDAAARVLGRSSATTFENSAPLADPHLTFLGDVFVSPEWMPMRNVFSIGDALLLVGLCLVTVTASGIRGSRAAEHRHEDAVQCGVSGDSTTAKHPGQHEYN